MKYNFYFGQFPTATSGGSVPSGAVGIATSPVIDLTNFVGATNIELRFNHWLDRSGTLRTAIVLIGSFSDPGVNEPHNFEWQAISSNGQSVATQSGLIPAGGAVPTFSFTPTGNGVFITRLSISDGQQSASSLATFAVGNVLPSSLNLFASPAVPLGQSIAVTGDFEDPGVDPWQATLVVRESGQAGELLRLPLVLTGKSFATSLVFGQSNTLELTYEVSDGSGVSISQPVVVAVGDQLQGDINGDGRVDLRDVVILHRNFGLTSGATASQGDWNGDGAVDRRDVAILAQNFGRTLAGLSPPAAADVVLAHAAGVEPVVEVARSLATSVTRRRPRMVRRVLEASRVDLAIDSAVAEGAGQSNAELKALRAEHQIERHQIHSAVRENARSRAKVR